MPSEHIVNLSGGKDSQTCAELAAMRGKPFRLVIADTGNEHELTWQHVETLQRHFGQKVEIARADFTARIAAKRDYVRTHWADDGVPQDRIERALDILQPTGNPFLDLCIWKGRFPSRRAQFCTEFLKAEAIMQQILEPALKIGPVIQWLGVRRAESLARRDAVRLRIVRGMGAHSLTYYSPIIHWTAENVVEFNRARGLELNPLYRMGMNRVGCFPCINAKKSETDAIFSRFPDVLDRLREWEAIVADASKRGAATFFAAVTTPEGAKWAREYRRRAEIIATRENPDDSPSARSARVKAIAADLGKDHAWPKIDEVASWASTGRGGVQWDLLFEDRHTGCSSELGLCE